MYCGDINLNGGMNYHGVTLDNSLSEETMDKALIPALMQVGQDNSVPPVRGPKRFENEGYSNYTQNSSQQVIDDLVKGW